MTMRDAVDALLAPFEGEDPTGQDPRSSEDFDAIGIELGKIGGVDQVPVDWKRVARESAALLQNHGKDLRLALYWVAANIAVEGPGSLHVGVGLLNRLLEAFGNKIHPRRPRARSAVLSWFAERIDADVRQGSFSLTTDEKAELLQALDRTVALSGQLEVDGAPLRRVQSLVMERGTVKLSEAEQRAEVLGHFDPEFAELAVKMLAHDSLINRTARGLRIHRFALWDSIPSLTDGVLDTTFDQSSAEELRTLLEKQAWADLLERAETSFSSNPFWLDLTFYTARAALHVFGREAATGVVGLLRDVLAREPGLVYATDAAGQPLASEDTLAWIEENVFDARETKAESNEVLPKEVRDLLDEGRLRDALLQASGWISHPEGRVRFARSVTLAEVFGTMNSPNNAHIVFRGLHNYLRQMTVKEWDPPIFAACIRGYLSTKRDVMGLGPEDEHLMDELSAMDPASLLSILPP